jgi:replicative DNA helicase
MGKIAVGDRVVGPDEIPTRVVATTPVMLGRPCFGVEFSGGEVIRADANTSGSSKTACRAEAPREGKGS